MWRSETLMKIKWILLAFKRNMEMPIYPQEGIRYSLNRKVCGQHYYKIMEHLLSDPYHYII
jgi:hypothetical protein